MAKLRLITYSEAQNLTPDLQKDLMQKFEYYGLKSLPALKEMLNRTHPHVLMVSLSPKNFGFLNMLRGHKGQLPFGLIVLTPTYSIEGERLAFQVGADHFMLISTPPKAIVQRVKSLGERMEQLLKSESKTLLPIPAWRDGYLRVEKFEVDAKSKLVTYDKRPLNLTPIQNQLLTIFLQQADQLISREDLKQQIWKDVDISTRSIDAHIAKLKKAIPELKDSLQSIYGRGYLLDKKKIAAAS